MRLPSIALGIALVLMVVLGAWTGLEPSPAPEWARYALLERNGEIVTYSRKKIRTRAGWAVIVPPKPSKPYRVHVRDDCRALIVRAYPGLTPSWTSF
jgi:hypothetical protein